jgi:GTP-binding protein
VRVRQVEFAGAIAEPGKPAPERLPQVAVAGRSNVGKSTLLNRLVGRKKLARTSKRPGKTTEINFYRVNGRFLLADLPGYGFARVPDEVRRRWGPLIESYLGGSPDLLGIVLLIDARHGPTDDDRRMVEYLARLGLPALFVLTKIDKLKRAERRKAVERAKRELDVPEDQVLVTSGTTGEGVGSLRDSIGALLEEAG